MMIIFSEVFVLKYWSVEGKQCCQRWLHVTLLFVILQYP